MLVDFCLPLYNEELIFSSNAKIILDFLNSKSWSFQWRLIFIVNGSSSSFEQEVKDFSNKNRSETACFIVPEAGKGGALASYFNQSHADTFVYMDIDLATSLDDLDKLLKPILSQEADLVMGSRMQAESKRQRGFLRELSSRAYISLSKLFLHHPFSDLQCGFKAIRAEAWHQVRDLIKDKAWFFDTELVYYIWKKGYKVREVAIDWSENRYQQRNSKLKLLPDAIYFIKKLWRLSGRHF